MKVIFMGTPEFAVSSLDAIFQSKHKIAAVVTSPDKPSGRGQQLSMSAVKEYALVHELPVLQPEKLKDPQFLENLHSLQADVFVVVAFRMLPEAVYAMPPKGTFNIHASLLPQYRGAAPIHWAVINGETKTGVSSFFLNHEIDKGDMIDQMETYIAPNETTGELYERLMKMGAELAVKTLDNIEENRIVTVKQSDKNEEDLKAAPKLFKENARIDWNQPAQTVHNFIRGMSPFPGAYTYLQTSDGKKIQLKCYKSEISHQKSTENTGILQTDGRKFLAINTSDELIFLTEVQFEGKSRMKIKDFLAGFHSEKYYKSVF